ncbi:phage tail tape measure protein [Williamsia sp.]|uniref:phage tail tape measure protein n=1 Tax=Williamsia sp. TaxID=1872085 RepID=UPI002F954800
MAGLIVGRLTAQLGLDDSGFTSGVKRAGSSMQTLGGQAKQAEQSISTAMKGAVSDVDRYAAKVATARANQAAAASRAEKAEKALKDAQNDGNAQKAADAEIRLAQARARLTTATQTTQEAVAGLTEANNAAAETTDGATESITNMGEESDNTATKLVALAAGAVSAGIGISAILTTGMAYTTSLNEMQAVSSATSQQMKAVSSSAKALGGDITLPGTSANNAAAAMTELAKGGFSVEESMGAAKGTLQLAAAAQIDAADAATIQSQALQAFGKDATYASEAADILANTSNASSAEITDVADALAQSGTVAAGFGVSMADTATMIGLFANAGITGSDAGTLLKTSLQSLTDQGEPAQQAIADLGLTVYDAQGKFVGMRSLWEQLSAASRNMTDEQYQASTSILFGSDAMRTAMVAAGGGTAAYDKMAEAIARQGTAGEIAAAKTQGLPGAWERVKNSLEGLSLTAYDAVQGPLTSLASSGANMIGVADGMTSSLGFVVAPVAALADAFGAIPGPLQLAITLLVAAKIASAAFAGQIATARGHVSAAGQVVRNFSRDVGQMQRAAAIAGGSMNRVSGAIAVMGRNSPTIATMGAAYLRASGHASTFARTQGVAAAAAAGMRSAVGGLTSALGGPFGIAIMGAIALMTLWQREKQKDAQASAEAAAKQEAFAQVYTESGSRMSEAARAWSAENNRATINMAEQMGESREKVNAALVGSQADYDRYIQHLRDANPEGGMMLGLTIDSLDRARETMLAGERQAENTGEATGSMAEQFTRSATSVSPMTDAMQEFVESTDGAADKVDKLAKALDGLQDDAMTEEEALQGWADGMRDLVKAMGEGGAAAIGLNGQIDVTTEAGSKLQDSVRDQASAFNEMAAATFEAARANGQDLPAALDTTRTKLQQQRTAFVDQMTAILGSREQAEALADTYGLIPENVVLNLDTTSVQRAIDLLGTVGQTAMALPPGSVRVVDNTPETLGNLDRLKITYTTLPDGRIVITDTTAENIKALNDLGIKTENLPQGFVKIEDTSKANIKALNDVGIKTINLPDGSVIIAVDDAAAIEKMRFFERPRRTTVSVDLVRGINSSGISDAVGNMGFSRYGSIQTFREGGHWIDKPMQAGIYRPAADYTIFAEKETKGETYLPWDTATRGRSLGIMQETANAWGYQVVPANAHAFMDGGITAGGFNRDAAVSTAQAHDDEPYVYGGLDCSGYLSAIHSEGTGQQVRFTTDSDFLSMGWVPGDDPGGWTIGTNGGSGENGHMAGRLFGVPVESGGNGVQYGEGAQDPTNFPTLYHWPAASAATQGEGIPEVDTRTEKQKNIDIVVAEGKRRGETDAEIKSAVMAMLDETDGQNLDHGMDGDNAGIFQQRSSWGTKEQRMDPAYATNAYYDALNEVDQEGLTEAQMAQAVQRSGTADGSNYAEKEAEADAEIAASITRSTQSTASSAAMGSGETINAYITNWPSTYTSTTASSTTSAPVTESTTDPATPPEVFGKGPLPIVAYASGGMQGRPNGAEVLRGERKWVTQAGEAGVESFIPIDGSSRSVAIWEETGRKLGVLQSFADGGFAGYSADTSDALKPKNLYDWAALAAGGGFAIASAITPYVGMATSGQVSLGDLSPSFDTSSNSIDGISQMVSTALQEVVDQLIELNKATRDGNKKLHSTADPNSGAGLILSAAGL